MAKILVADDEEGLRSFIAEALELDGHTVAQAEDGAVATELLAKNSYDLLVTDLRMPKVDGMALLRQTKTDQPQVEVIVLTAYGSVDTAVEAMRLGAFDYLQKPISGPTELRLLASRALERKELVTSRERNSRQHQVTEAVSYEAPAMKTVNEALRKVAKTDATVLLLGETGTGKEVAAQQIHRQSKRMAGPLVTINCAALSESLLESELFGHEKGAFTGADALRRGRVELADGGTFFLDEVGELKPSLQAKLLRVLQEKRFERVGGSRSIESDVRWIAATNRNLLQMVSDGDFREDLYHRLAVFPIELPPLRDRQEDILPLAQTLLQRIGPSLGWPSLQLSPSAEAALQNHDWPGNIRALSNALERAAILSEGQTIDAEHILLTPSKATPAASEVGEVGEVGESRTLADLERTAISETLARLDGNRRKTAEELGIGLRTLYEKLKRYNIE
jgi:two-component system, NtrC family, response regulator AtoC